MGIFRTLFGRLPESPSEYTPKLAEYHAKYENFRDHFSKYGALAHADACDRVAQEVAHLIDVSRVDGLSMSEFADAISHCGSVLALLEVAETHASDLSELDPSLGTGPACALARLNTSVCFKFRNIVKRF